MVALPLRREPTDLDVQHFRSILSFGALGNIAEENAQNHEHNPDKATNTRRNDYL